MARYPFLSEEWIELARSIRAEYKTPDRDVPAPPRVRMNQVITNVPFGTGAIEAHLDTTSGDLELDLGHINPVDLSVTLDYEMAKTLLIEGNIQAGFQAFMVGRIKVDGDMSKLLDLQSVVPQTNAQELAGRIRDITA
ncbi:MAG: hypothetical protein ACYDEY_01975 [Acidimicrobiales bacterium]